MYPVATRSEVQARGLSLMKPSASRWLDCTGFSAIFCRRARRSLV